MAACLMGMMDDNSEKQGIVSILCSDSDRATCKSATSLRRTMSADMSSKKWLSENGFSPIKRVASSEDIWSSIVSQNAKHDSSASYVHPLVKRSVSSLSKKSLEVCTESLGSETGSDGFSGDSEEEKQQQQKQKITREVNYDFTPTVKKLTTPPSFPPPLPSRGDGPSLRVKPRRENGRLVLEAVSVASGQNNFKAKRHDGRLVLTLLKEEKVNENESQWVKESTEPSHEVHRLALTVGSTWAHNFNSVVKFESRSLRPPRFNVEILANQVRNHNLFSLNAYDYYWRSKPTTAQAMEKIGGNKYIISKNNASMIITNNYYNQEDYMVKGCKEHRRSLFREPYCIDTS